MLSTAYVYLLALGFLFLPFMKALTVDIGFPLKIYEVVFAAAIMVFIISARRIDRTILMRFGTPLLLFLVVATASYFMARYEADDFSDVATRSGAAADGAFRLVYAAFNVALMVVAAQGARRHDKLLYMFWQAGMVLSALYSVYCAYALTRFGEAFMMPGIERHQLGGIGPLTVSRSGTFEEGNFAGLYFLASMALAVYRRHAVLAGIALLALFLTKSAAGYFALIVMAAVYGYITSRSRARRILIIGALAVSVAGTLAFFQSEDKFEYRAGSSGGVRLNEAMTGIEMAKDKPLLGFSLGGYGYSYWRYQWEPDLSSDQFTDRRIAGVVYVEILAETGLLGFLLFFTFWRRWYLVQKQSTGRAKIFQAFGISMFLAWFAFPTFSISYIWAFAGFVLAIQLMRAPIQGRKQVTRRRRGWQGSIPVMGNQPGSVRSI